MRRSPLLPPSRFVTPTIRFCNPAHPSWPAHIDAVDSRLLAALDWIDRVNGTLYRSIDDLYDGT